MDDKIENREEFSEIHRHWETGTRYYSAHLVKDLFGEWIVDRYWGGRFNNHRRWKAQRCCSYQDGVIKIETLGKIRKKHQYRELI
jgi:hypothetical protein